MLFAIRHNEIDRGQIRTRDRVMMMLKLPTQMCQTTGGVNYQIGLAVTVKLTAVTIRPRGMLLVAVRLG
jgi:hypothetical protein